MRSKVFSDWLPSYIKATLPVLEIFKMAGQASYMAHTNNNSAVSSLVVSMDELALQEHTNNVAFVLRVGLFSFCASGIKSCICNHMCNLAGRGGDITQKSK